MKLSSEKSRLLVRRNEIRPQTNAKALQRCSRVTHYITGGLPVPFCAVALLLCALSPGCQNAASDLSLSSLLEVTDSDFQQRVLKADQPVLVEFWAPWCRPCVEMVPILEQVSEQFAGRVKILRIRIDDNPATAAKYEIDAPPAFLLFHQGMVFKRRLGKQSEAQLTELISSILSKEISE
ncbi:MAG: hypothetical protein CME32_04595 [Gimesia sp.]|nr:MULTISPECIES: thioredoxin domain-containing protein [Gimesia]MAC55577.1 hypothetical protein [Gimesia sp.]MBN68545.1 hypothetical protein [Gimesia sp.]HAW32714.1 hypothetical protein [Planctomycetaceae bacterium]HCO27368.1 hypothetical protein [Gimesia maris]